MGENGEMAVRPFVYERLYERSRNGPMHVPFRLVDDLDGVRLCHENLRCEQQGALLPVGHLRYRVTDACGVYSVQRPDISKFDLHG